MKFNVEQDSITVWEQREIAEKAKCVTREEQQIKFLTEQRDRDREKSDSAISKMKLFGDAIRNSIVKMGNDPLDLIPFFDHVDKLFYDLRIPENLRVTLLRAYVNDKARLLISRLDAARAADNKFVKCYLMDQFKLVPQFFMEQFTFIVRQPLESFKAFVFRLTLLLDYYMSSRYVKDLNMLC